MTARLPENLDLIATAPDGIQKLRRLILELAVRGKLVPQDPNDEPASELLKRIAKERARLEAEGICKKSKPMPPVGEDEQPLDLPENWRWTNLASVSLVNPRNVADDSVEASFVPMAMIGNRFEGAHRQELRKWGEIKQGFTHFAEGDIGVAKITPCFENSKACVFSGLQNGIGAGTTELHIVRPVAQTISPRFVLAYLKAPMFLAVGETKMTGTAGQKRLPKDFLEANPFPLPPLAEQHRIVAKVDELMALCDRLEAEQADAGAAHARLVATLLGTLTQSADAAELAANWQRLAEHFDSLFTTESSLDALKKTILQLAVMGKLVPRDPNDEPASELLKRIATERARLEAEGICKRSKPLPPVGDDEWPFDLPAGWEWVRLGTLLSKLGAGSTPLGGKQVYVNEGVKFLRSQNVWNDGLRLDDVALILPEVHLKMSGTHVEAGDLLFNITGASIGRCAAVPQSFDTGNVSQHVTIIRLVSPDTRQFLHSVLTSNLVQQTVMDVQVGVSREGLSIGKLAQFVIPLPPLAEQHRIVAKVDELLALCDRLKAGLAESRARQERLAATLIESALQAA